MSELLQLLVSCLEKLSLTHNYKLLIGAFWALLNKFWRRQEQFSDSSHNYSNSNIAWMQFDPKCLSAYYVCTQ